MFNNSNAINDADNVMVNCIIAIVWPVGWYAGQLEGQTKLFLFCAAIALKWSTLLSLPKQDFTPDTM